MTTALIREHDHVGTDAAPPAWQREQLRRQHEHAVVACGDIHDGVVEMLCVGEAR